MVLLLSGYGQIQLTFQFIWTLFVVLTELNTIIDLTPEQDKEVVFKSSNIFWEMDPMHTWMIKDCNEEVLPLLTKLLSSLVSLNTWEHAKWPQTTNDQPGSKETQFGFRNTKVQTSLYLAFLLYCVALHWIA